jgi:hypothetical protein
VLAKQGRQLANQLFVATGTIRKGAPGHQLKPPMARTIQLPELLQPA